MPLASTGQRPKDGRGVFVSNQAWVCWRTSFIGKSVSAMIRIPTRPFACLLAISGCVIFGCGSNSEAVRTESAASVDSNTSPDSQRVDTTIAAADAIVSGSGSPKSAATQTGATQSAEPRDRDAQVATAISFAEQGDFDQAASALKTLLLVDPTDVEVLFHLGNIEAARGNLHEAVETLAGIPDDHPEAGIPALGQSADWCLRLEMYEQAERRYLKILDYAPGAYLARRQLAQLLNRQGRRHEAAEHIRELCKQGNVRQDELHALIVLSDAMTSDPDEAASGEVDYSPIGASGEARKLFTERRYADAVAVLRDTVAAGDAPPSVVAFYGRAVAEAQDDQEFLRWIGRTDESVRQFSEYWSAVAAYLASRQQYDAAARALLEALDRDSTDFTSMNRLNQMLKLLDQPSGRQRWEERWRANHDVLLSNNAISDSATPNVEAMEELAARLNAIDRRLEAVMWKSLESHYRNLPSEAMQHWNRERQKLVASGDGFPNRASRLANTSLDAFPLPNVESISSHDAAATNDRDWIEEKPHPASFSNVAGEIGLAHSYRLASTDIDSGFAMYHQAGGGVAVLDYDHDGSPDLYFAQGAADPPAFISAHSNLLYRTEAARLVDVTGSAMAEEFRYTIGVTAGDWNQDGFPDLITANIGANRLLINNGDGTFTASAIAGTDDLQRMPSSVAIADLTGDSLPDLFEVNYIQDPQIAKLPKRNEEGRVIEAVGPGDFSPAVDRIGVNDGQGRVVFTSTSDEASEAHKGLGVVIANFDDRPGNDVFVGNDKSANQLWVRNNESNVWSDTAVVSGIAFSYGGAGTASMGIAAGDFDKRGTLDLHVANFQDESVCLYLNQDAFFQDRAVQFKLGVPSRSVLGFGSQSLDFDNNGLLDLVVTNGHIDQYEGMSGPFEQLPQLFCNLGDKFQQVDVADSSSYWQTGHLGRALARLDFNRDGKNDFVVTHLGETSALMLNQTPTSGHWLQLQLAGVDSERDAVGARVRIQVGERESTDWVIGGDGYLCRNEQVVSFGLGEATRVDEIVIDWPSGQRQTMNDVPVDRRILIVEGDPKPFTFGM